MTLKESFVTCMQKYTDFSGRAPRSEYWWFILAQLLVGFAIGFVLGLIGAAQLASGVSLIVSLGFILPSIAVAVRRLHDIGKSGWWYLLVFIPILGWLLLLFWFVQPSAEESNEFGDVPAL